ncbi:MAG TPA: nucleotidyltransferase domain-containing protein, partial [Bradyrhizobium sp.]
ECDPPAELSREVSDLMSRKLATRELGVAPLPPVVASFIDSEFELARPLFESGRPRAAEEGVIQAEQFYKMVVERLEREGQ